MSVLKPCARCALEVAARRRWAHKGVPSIVVERTIYADDFVAILERHCARVGRRGPPAAEGEPGSRAGGGVLGRRGHGRLRVAA